MNVMRERVRECECAYMFCACFKRAGLERTAKNRSNFKKRHEKKGKFVFTINRTERQIYIEFCVKPVPVRLHVTSPVENLPVVTVCRDIQVQQKTVYCK